MRKKRLERRLLVIAGLMSLVLVPLHPTQARTPRDAAHAPSTPPHDFTDQLIIKLRDPQTTRARMLSADRLGTLSATAGITLEHFRPMSGDAQVLKLPHRMTLAEAQAIAVRLNADPSVEYAEPDRRMFPMLVPNDPQYVNQWHYKESTLEVGGANLPGAWDITTGSASVVVAVVDTGILPNHEDLVGRTVPGYDFINDAASANDSDGRDADPSDPGDWVTVAEDAAVGGPFEGCGASDSSWHGTHVAGTIGATTNNGVGVAGTNWTSKILPVRVLGKCGGFLSDIIDGSRWAAGLPVTGVPANANPAKVLNLSLGGAGPCSVSEQTAINQIIAAGAVFVVAAGNSNANASGHSPANCIGVITVAAVNRAGGRAFYSNFGTSVEIAAPGGEQSVANDPGVLSTLNTGTTIPVADAYIYYQGTSMATPHVAGIASLMLSVNPSLAPAQVLSAIQATSRAFPTGTGSSGGDCTPALCGTGIIDAAAAVARVRPADLGIAVVDSPDPATAGSNLSYAITASNAGPGAAQAVTVADVLPAGTSFVSAGPSQGSCSGTTTVTCSLGSIASGANATVTLVVTPTAAGTLSNTATVASSTSDPVSGNNSATATTTVNIPVNPVPAISTLGPSTARQGGWGFTLTVSGSNLVNGSVVRWNGVARATAYASAGRLTAVISAGDIKTAGTAAVTVFNPAPGGGTSNAVTFMIGGGDTPCFVATAAYGTPMAQEVRYLRAFRDQVLLRTAIGKRFVELYYEHSPSLADALRRHDGLRALARVALAPLVALSKTLLGPQTRDTESADQP